MHPTHDSKGRPYPPGFFDPTMLTGKPFDSTREDFGPVYPALPGLDKFRRRAASGDETDDDRRAYGRAVGEAFRKLMAPKGARWTWKVDLHYDTRRTVAADMARQAAAAMTADRARRSDAEIIEAYKVAMAEKAARLAQAADIAPEPIAATDPLPLAAEIAFAAPELPPRAKPARSPRKAAQKARREFEESRAMRAARIGALPASTRRAIGARI